MKSKDFEQGLGFTSQEKRFTKSSPVEEGLLSRQVIDLSQFTPNSRAKATHHFLPVGVLGRTEILARQKETIQAGSTIEIRTGGSDLVKVLAQLQRDGYQIELQSATPEPSVPGPMQKTDAFLRGVDRYDIKALISAYGRGQVTPEPEKRQTEKAQPAKPTWKALRILATAATAIASLAGLGDKAAHAEGPQPIPTPVRAIHQTLPENFQTSAKALDVADVACKGYTKIAGDKYGPEISRECLEVNPQDISATDYVKDATGDVIIQRAVVNRNELWESKKDPATGAFSDFKFVSKVSMESVRSMVSSSDGNTVIFGGEDPIRSGLTTLRISSDGGKNMGPIDWPYQNSAATIDLFRVTDANFLGNNGNYEGGIGPFIISVDPITKKAAVKAASLATIQPVSINIGSAHDLGIASIDIANHVADFVSNAAFNLQRGLLIGNIDYINGLGSVKHIKQTLINGTPVELGFLYGNDTYFDDLGHIHVKTSDVDKQVLFDIDTITTEGTALNYANLCDNKNIPDYMKGSLVIATIDVLRDNQGNLHTKTGGGYGSMTDGLGRAIFVDVDTSECTVLEPKMTSEVSQQKNMLRQKINGQMGYTTIIWRFGQAFIPDGGVPIYTDRNLGGNKNNTNNYNLYLPVISRQSMGGR